MSDAMSVLFNGVVGGLLGASPVLLFIYLRSRRR
jgi:hypothetical protein